MNNFRRRVSNATKEYTFIANETSYSVSWNTTSISVSIDSTVNGNFVPYVVQSYNGIITSATVTDNGVTISFQKNNTISVVTGKVILKQNDSNKTIQITVTQTAGRSYFRLDKYTSGGHTATIDDSTHANPKRLYVYASDARSSITVTSKIGDRFVPFTVTSFGGIVTNATASSSTIIANFTENTTNNGRTGTITIKQSETNESRTIELFQYPYVPE